VLLSVASSLLPLNPQRGKQKKINKLSSELILFYLLAVGDGRFLRSLTFTHSSPYLSLLFSFFLKGANGLEWEIAKNPNALCLPWRKLKGVAGS